MGFLNTQNSQCLRGVFDLLKDMVIIIENDSIVEVNRAFLNFFKEFKISKNFYKNYNSICRFFGTIDRENYISCSDNLDWLEHILKNRDRVFKVLIERENREYIFSVDVKILKERKFVVVFNDITDIEEYQLKLEEKIEEELKRRLKSERIYKKLISSTFDGVLILDESAKILTWSKSCEKIFHFREREVIGESLDEIVTLKEHRESFRERIGEFLSKSSKHKAGMIEFEGIDKFGNRLLIELSLSTVKIDGSWSSIGILRDITQKRKLEREKNEKEKLLIQQSKMAQMGEMIGAIAHQWKQPLNTLSLIAQNIKLKSKRNLLNQDEVTKSVDKILKQVKFMTQTVDDFRSFFKPSKERVNFSLKESINDILNILNIQFQKHQILVNIYKSESLDDRVFGYPNEFKQVVLNILTNAKDAIESKSNREDFENIDIYISNLDRELILEFQDSAGGIDSEIIDRLFEPYTSTKGSSGTGIGLHMSKMIVENMNGVIEAQNTKNGASFKIKFKISDN